MSIFAGLKINQKHLDVYLTKETLLKVKRVNQFNKIVFQNIKLLLQKLADTLNRTCQKSTFCHRFSFVLLNKKEYSNSTE